MIEEVKCITGADVLKQWMLTSTGTADMLTMQNQTMSDNPQEDIDMRKKMKRNMNR